MPSAAACVLRPDAPARGEHPLMAATNKFLSQLSAIENECHAMDAVRFAHPDSQPDAA